MLSQNWAEQRRRNYWLPDRVTETNALSLNKETVIMKWEQIKTVTAPAANGTYSQALKCYETVYISDQLPLVPEIMELVSTDVTKQIKQVINNIVAAATASGG